ncbi:MAG TPA: ABC transporter substrate-binding protein [Chloroflexota bacterium]|nr:ABC transporter substrate-binding protein [Chloroflexota bacterium]
MGSTNLTIRARLAVGLCGLTLALAACSAPAATTPAATTAAAPPAAGKPAATTAPAVAAGGATTAAPTGTPIKVGIMDDVTGVGAIEGALMRVSSELAIQRANASGGINGHPLQPIYVDPKGDANQAQQLAQQLAQQDNVDVLSGGIFSPECLGVQALAAKLQIVYVPLNGCASDALTTKSCDKYTFRVYPAGRQTTDTAVAYEVKTFGPKWAIIYPDYALGQSDLATSKAALAKNGGEYVTEIPVPLGEANVTPYVTKVPTDGSVTVLNVRATGSDLARVMSVIQQFGINQKVAIVTALGKESFAGVYPEALNGAIITGTRPSDGLPGNADDQKYMDDWLALAKKNPDLIGPLGGVDHVTPGNNNGYNAYMSMTALVLAMRKANFTGKADTEKLVSAFETLTVPQGPDFPDGQLIMNKDDHQGRTTYYLLKINGQKEEVVQSFPADQLPTIGDCKIA